MPVRARSLLPTASGRAQPIPTAANRVCSQASPTSFGRGCRCPPAPRCAGPHARDARHPPPTHCHRTPPAHRPPIASPLPMPAGDAGRVFSHTHWCIGRPRPTLGAAGAWGAHGPALPAPAGAANRPPNDRQRSANRPPTTCLPSLRPHTHRPTRTPPVAAAAVCVEPAAPPDCPCAVRRPSRRPLTAPQPPPRSPFLHACMRCLQAMMQAASSDG